MRSPQKDPSKLLRASNDGKVQWNTSSSISAEYATAILASDWLYFSRHEINRCTFLIHFVYDYIVLCSLDLCRNFSEL